MIIYYQIYVNNKLMMVQCKMYNYDHVLIDYITFGTATNSSVIGEISNVGGDTPKKFKKMII